MFFWALAFVLLGIGLMLGIERVLRWLCVQRVDPSDAPPGLREAMARFVAAAEKHAETRRNHKG